MREFIDISHLDDDDIDELQNVVRDNAEIIGFYDINNDNHENDADDEILNDTNSDNDGTDRAVEDEDDDDVVFECNVMPGPASSKIDPELM